MAPTVLVVDDDAAIRMLIKMNLELEGFRVHTAADGVECLRQVSLLRPQLITLDVMMPRLDGYRTAEALRRDPLTAGIPILMVSALAQQRDRRRALVAGADEYITKPFDPAELVASARRLAGAITSEGDP